MVFGRGQKQQIFLLVTFQSSQTRDQTNRDTFEYNLCEFSNKHSMIVYYDC